MTQTDVDTDRYVVISADTHGGTRADGYEPYVDREFRADFTEWVTAFLREVDATRVSLDRALAERGADADSLREFHALMALGLGDGTRRVEALETDGIAGSVIFVGTDLDTLPPFNAVPVSLGSVTARRYPRAHRWAGARAYNRWLAEYCSTHPERLAGIMILPDVVDVDEAVREVRWGAEAGLRGGITMPPMDLDLPGYSDPSFDPLWAACCEYGMPVNVHVGNQGADPRLYGATPFAGFIAAAEAEFWARRPLRLLMLGGAFERFPDLRLVFAEMHADWIPDELAALDRAFDAGVVRGNRTDAFSLSPREYWARNCAVGATFMTPREARMRDDIGIGTIMWGSDFPHPEGTYPFTQECLRRTFHDVPRDEVQLMLAGNAARVYGFDLDALRPIADRIGPRVSDLAEPLDVIPDGFRRWAMQIGGRALEDA